MDLNDFGGNGFIYAGIPLGVEPSIIFGENSNRDYDSLTEAEKEQLLMQCKDAKTVKEMQKVVDSSVADTDVRAVVDAEAEANSTNRHLM